MNNLLEAVRYHLSQQGLSDVSDQVSHVVLEHALSWKLQDEGTPEAASIIIAFAFGFRFDLSGNRLPGPINEQLADTVERHYKLKPRPIYAQWEIAQVLAGRVADLIPIYPIIDRSSGTTIYLSTKGVLESVKRKIEPDLPDSMGPALVIAHRDHLLRCARLTSRFGFSIVTQQDAMPSGYDAESGQLWTTSKLNFILSEIMTRLADVSGPIKRIDPHL